MGSWWKPRRTITRNGPKQPPPHDMPGTHVILIDRELAVSVKDAGRQIAGLFDLLEGGRRYLEGKRLTDYTGGVFIYTPKARRG